MQAYKATQYQVPLDVRVQGVYLLGFYTHVNEDITAPLLEQYGLSIDALEPYDVYDYGIYFDLMRDIVASTGGTMTLVSIGQAVGATLVEHHTIMNPDELIESFVTGRYDEGIHDAPVGYGFSIEQIGPQHIRLTNNTALPNAFVYGLLHESLRILATGTFALEQLSELEHTSTEGAVFELRW